MRYRSLGRLGWSASEIGFGMWGLAGWTGSDDRESMQALERAVELGYTFFDTAWAYGDGRSERMLARVLRGHPGGLVAATKIPPKNRRWTGLAGIPLDDVFPADHIREYTHRSLDNLGLASIDLQQFHCWNDDWALDERWQRAVSDLKDEKVIRAFGISVNRWEPSNVLRALDTGLVDTVQVVYNVFDQQPEDELFAACRARQIGVIARVPFDEGSLTGTLTAESTWPDDDFRSIYFAPDNLHETLVRVDALRRDLPAGIDLPEIALRFILQDMSVSTTIPGMRRRRHVERNAAASDGRRLPDDVYARLRHHRWDRTMVLP